MSVPHDLQHWVKVMVLGTMAAPFVAAGYPVQESLERAEALFEAADAYERGREKDRENS